MTTEDKSLSGLWRKNASKDAGTDLASILDGARVIAQSLLPDTEVLFAGITTAQTDEKKLLIPAKGLGKEFPVPGAQVDRILGVAVHLMGHRLFADNQSEFHQSVLYTVGSNRSGADFKFANEVIDTMEDIYIDHLMTVYPGYHDYLRRERDASLAEVDVTNIAKPLMVECDRHDMLNVLVYIGLLGGEIPQVITQENLEILAKLLDVINMMVIKRYNKVQATAEVYKILTSLPDFIDHNKDGLMDKIKQEQQSGQPQQTPPSESDASSGADSDKKPEETKKQDKPEKSDKDTDSEDKDSEEEETENEEEGGEDSEDGEDNGEETEDEQEQGESEHGKSGDSEPEEEDNPEQDEPDEVEENEDGTGDGTPGTDKDEEQPDDGDTQPEPVWKPVDLAEKLDDSVNDHSRLSPTLADAVSEAMSEKRDDLSQLVGLLAKESDSTILTYTPEEGAVQVAEARSHTAETEEKLRRILQEYRLKRTKDYRGLLSGRVSNRRLYRTAYGDQRVFQRRERPEEIDMVVALCMDLSGSMKGSQELINEVVCAIADSFTKEKLEFIALGYSDSGKIVNIPRLYDKETGKVNLGLDVGIWDGTPSYEGLAAAVAQLLRLGGNKKKVLFHFSDGAPNSSNSPVIPNLLKDAKEKGIIAIHVCIDRTGSYLGHFKNIYGDDSLSITDISELPDVIDTELRRKLEAM